MKRTAELKQEAASLAADLAGKRWLLARPVYLHHAAEADRWLGGDSRQDPDRLALAYWVRR